MKLIKDEKLLHKHIQELNLESRFEISRLYPGLCLYEKGELLTAPTISQRYLLFIVSGAVQIYGIGYDGRKIPVNLAKKGSVIGDIEFCSARNSNLFSEAVQETLCIGISMQEARRVLKDDIRFLHYLLSELSKKVYLTNVSEVSAISVEEKLLLYMKEECEKQTMRGVEHTTMRLQCSRRQLQRVLSELCERGEIEKIGKGVYRLAKK